MKKIVLQHDSPMNEQKVEGTMLDVLQLACLELFPDIKRAGPDRCARSIKHLLVGMLYPNRVKGKLL